MSRMPPQHRAASVLHVGAYLYERGESPGQFLRDLNLPPETLLGSNIWLSRDAVLEMTQAIERLTGDPLLGFHIGAEFELRNYGEWTDRVTRSSTLGDALRLISLFIHQLETGTRLSLHRNGDRILFRSELLGSMAADPRHQYDGHFCVLLKLLQMAAEPVEAILRLPHHSRHLTAVEDLLGVRVIFDCEYAELEFEAGALELPLALSPIPEPQLLDRNELTCREVFQQISATADPERNSVKRIADDLFLNVRTMQRHLSAWGLSFEEILDGYRKRCALQQLLDARCSVTDIAHGLGYSDTAHFTRAFRRWYGVPPRSVRLEASVPAT